MTATSFFLAGIDRRRALLGVALLFLTSSGPAQELAGLTVGDPAPAFNLQDHAGQAVSLTNLLKTGPVAVVFFRSADW